MLEAGRKTHLAFSIERSAKWGCPLMAKRPVSKTGTVGSTPATPAFNRISKNPALIDAGFLLKGDSNV